MEIILEAILYYDSWCIRFFLKIVNCIWQGLLLTLVGLLVQSILFCFMKNELKKLFVESADNNSRQKQRFDSDVELQELHTHKYAI